LPADADEHSRRPGGGNEGDRESGLDHVARPTAATEDERDRPWPFETCQAQCRGDMLRSARKTSAGFTPVEVRPEQRGLEL
jgi:hypothetical protein